MGDNNESSGSLVASYLTLRKAIGWLGLTMPFVLSIGGLVIFSATLQDSISDYYYTGMENVFVGMVCVIGVFLFSYKGYEKKDDLAGDLACFFAVIVALFPTTPEHDPSSAQKLIGVIHFASAAMFFLILAYFSLCLFPKTSPTKKATAQKLARNKIYRICGALILVSLMLIAIFNLLPGSLADKFVSLRPVFFLEAIAMIAFGISWLVKGETVLADK